MGHSSMHMSSSTFQVLLSLCVCLGATACATTEPGSAPEVPAEQVGRVVERTLGAVVPGQVVRDPGLSAFDRNVAPSQERSGPPVPVYQHKVAVGADQVVTAVSESASYVQGSCVRLQVHAAPRPARILGATPCRP